MATIIAIAFHSPEEIENMLRPSVSELADTAQHDPAAWEQDQWWKDQN